MIAELSECLKWGYGVWSILVKSFEMDNCIYTSFYRMGEMVQPVHVKNPYDLKKRERREHIEKNNGKIYTGHIAFKKEKNIS